MSWLEDLLTRRRTTRSFAPGPLGRDDLAALLWAAHGDTGDGHRTSPPAHALHPVTVTVVAGNVQRLDPGIHVHDPGRGGLEVLLAGDHRASVAEATLADGDWVRTAPALQLLTADIAAANEHFAD